MVYFFVLIHSLIWGSYPQNKIGISTKCLAHVLSPITKYMCIIGMNMMQTSHPCQQYIPICTSNPFFKFYSLYIVSVIPTYLGEVTYHYSVGNITCRSGNIINHKVSRITCQFLCDTRHLCIAFTYESKTERNCQIHEDKNHCSVEAGGGHTSNQTYWKGQVNVDNRKKTTWHVKFHSF